jgi:hypothetical protein
MFLAVACTRTTPPPPPTTMTTTTTTTITNTRGRYTDVVNKMLERGHDAWRHRGGPAELTTEPIVRYIDDKPQCYRIDFAASTQTSQLNCVRRIAREEASPSPGQRWEFMNDQGVWQSYDSLEQGAVEAAARAYRAGTAGSRAVVTFPGRPEQYELDFTSGAQRNMQTGRARFFRRV